MTDPGKLNRRLVLEAPVESADGAGGVTQSFETAATLWAQVLPVSARASLDADHAGAAISHRIVIRHRGGLTTRHRLREGERVYRIVSLREQDDTRRFIEIAAQERVD